MLWPYEGTVDRAAQLGAGKFDAELFPDGKAFRPDGKPAATLIPPAFGLSGVDRRSSDKFPNVRIQSASHNHGRNLQNFHPGIPRPGSRQMGRATRGCRGPGRGYMGTARFPHQQFVLAPYGEGHRRRPSVPAVPWQG